MRLISSRHTVLSGIAALGNCVFISAFAQDIDPDRNHAAGTDAFLPTVEVVGRRQSGSYHAEEASGAKTDLPLRELPQAVRVMSRQTLDDLGATRIDDALDYVGGISRQNNFGGLWDNVAIRGLAGDINNGMPLLLNGFSGNRGFNAPRDSANVERIEFLKGPAASLYGTSEPGGTINVVTKKPLWKAARSAELYAGSDDFYRAALDATAPLGERIAYRLNAAFEARGSFRDHVDTRRAVLAPALAWKIAPSTRLDYSGEVLRHETPLDRGIAAVGNRLGDLPRSRFLGEPADGNIRIENQTHQLTLEHMFDARWSSRVGLSYKDGTLKGYSTEAQPALQPDGRTLRRQRRYRDYASDDVTLQAELVGRLQAGSVAHELLAGMETYRFSLDQRMLRANPGDAAPYAIDIFDPLYGQPRPVPLPSTDTSEEQKNLAFYVQDAISLGEHWRLLAGVRLDRYDQSLRNNRTGARGDQSPTAASPRLGISYLPDTQWTLFANAGKSFRPNNGTSASASPFDPESGRAAEVGAKWENAARTLGATLALYDIRKKNVLTADPSNAGFSIAAGEVRSRGMDFDLSGQLSRHWRINASLAYVDASVERDNLLETGGDLLNIPRVSGSVLAMYEDAFADGARYGIGGGLTYSASRLGEARTRAQAGAGAPAFELPSYTVARLTAYWSINPKLRLSLDVENLLDKTYYTSSFQRTWVTVGNPRTVVLGLQTKF